MRATARCDACNKRIRRNQHELVLSDLETGQVLGHYHARPECQQAAAKYLTRGTVLMATFVRPDRCGEAQQQCDGGLSEWAA